MYALIRPLICVYELGGFAAWIGSARRVNQRVAIYL